MSAMKSLVMHSDTFNVKSVNFYFFKTASTFFSSFCAVLTCRYITIFFSWGIVSNQFHDCFFPVLVVLLWLSELVRVAPSPRQGVQFEGVAPFVGPVARFDLAKS